MYVHNLLSFSFLKRCKNSVMYGSQCWLLRKTEEDKQRIFERKVLRKIYGPCFDQQTRVWRKRHIQDLKDLFKRSDIVNEIKRNKLEWAGHVCRKQNSMVKKCLKKTQEAKDL